MGMIGAIAGGVLGAIGGIIGTWFSIKNAANNLQRTFIIRYAVLIWAFILAFVALIFFLPAPWRHFIWIPYGAGLPMIIIWGNRRLARLRADDKDTTSCHNS